MVQVVGAVAWGPKTVKVTGARGVGARRPASTELMLVVAMAVPAVPVAGPVVVRVGAALPTTVSDIVAPQVEVAVLLLASPP